MSYLPNPDRYQDKAYRRCGRSGLLLPPVSLGLWHNFGGIDDYARARDIVLRAFDLGITHLDLANNYGPPPGSAEETLGLILQQDLGKWRDELIIATKAGYRMGPGPYGEWGSRKYLLSSLDQSLRRMKLDYVDIFYSHRPDPETPLEETMGALVQAVHSGKALYVGISNYPADMTRQAARLLREAGVPLLIHQARYNLLDRWIEKGLTDVLTEEGAGCIAFSPLAQGLLTNRYLEGIAADSRVAKQTGFLKKEDVATDKLEKVRALHLLALKRGQTLAQLALSWLLHRPAITSVLIGASKVSQLEDNFRAAQGAGFSEEELLEIEAACQG
ncbi:MAG: aldo/keto reductase [Candidatus Methylacidiphilales bacterium]|nr:aldo/keto reductase [Candidatus Methylacidiphilales bacterium]